MEGLRSMQLDEKEGLQLNTSISQIPEHLVYTDSETFGRRSLSLSGSRFTSVIHCKCVHPIRE